ncbi:ProQ/FINO family protein [Morganella morganii]|uniref:ProQ/FINO family protein n=1 Tax=Morganella morganii TaxID=582 RepID=UPI002367AFE3|nr:ProQ/FINO family protein [Morganella morganii]
MATVKAKRKKEAKALLEGFWGKAFNFKRPKPLKLGVEQDLLEAAEALGLPFDEDTIKRVLAAYLYTIPYRKAVAGGTSRYDLNGDVSGEITDEERQEAKEAILHFYARQEEKKKNRAIDTENKAKAEARKIAHQKRSEQ